MAQRTIDRSLAMLMAATLGVTGLGCGSAEGGGPGEIPEASADALDGSRETGQDVSSGDQSARNEDTGDSGTDGSAEWNTFVEVDVQADYISEGDGGDGDVVANAADGDDGEAAFCTDGIVNGTETDVDCGGSCLTKCGSTNGCVGDGDCASGFCHPTSKTCASPTCSDGLLNGTETDVDCGGSCSTMCGYQESCLVNGDCIGGLCTAKVCAATCSDGVKNGSETDADCGGSCLTKCGSTSGCLADGDCASGFCHPTSKTCASPTCSDGLRNDTETDVDCGGSCPTKCGAGGGCAINDDCSVTLLCTSNKCALPASCLAMHLAYPLLPDDNYWIDPAGQGGTTQFVATCDMTTNGGGWTRVVAIKGDSIAHGDNPDAYGDVSTTAAPAKVSDATINLLTTLGYWRYSCGAAYSAFVKNDSRTWTSTKSNMQNWSTDRDEDLVFECAGANRDGYVFSDFVPCPGAYSSWVAAGGLAEGSGCFNSTEGWGQDGGLWAR